MSAFDALLTVQRHDTTADQLRHRRATLPERAAVADQTARLAAIDEQLAVVAEQRDTLARSQKRLDDDVASIDAKIADEEAKLYSGSVSAARELQALQEEIEALRRRKRSLEDDEIEIMERLEPVEAEAGRLEAERRDVAAGLASAADALAAAEAEVDGELDEVVARRGEAVGTVGDDALVAEYEALRGQLGGVAVAPLTDSGACGGCHLVLSAMERDRIKKLPADARVTCEECGRLLVR